MRKALYIGGGVLLFIVLVVVFFRPSSDEDLQSRPISSMIADAKSGHVEQIVVRDNILEITQVGGFTYETRKEEGVSVYTLLESNDVNTSQILIEVKEESGFVGWLGLLLNFLPLLIFLGLIYALIRAINKISSRQ